MTPKHVSMTTEMPILMPGAILILASLIGDNNNLTGIEPGIIIVIPVGWENPVV